MIDRFTRHASTRQRIDRVTQLLQRESVLVGLLVALALALRLWALADVPPGWRDDELSNSLVISQHVLDGDLRLFYADASGHEFLYHAANALFLRLFGPGLWGIRLLSVLFGTGVVGLTYLLARELFGRPVGWIAALGVTTSFWALMYSRVGQRHISAVFFALAAFLFLWRALLSQQPTNVQTNTSTNPSRNAILAGLALGLGFYTYFASRIALAVVVALALYLLLFGPRGRSAASQGHSADRKRWGRPWRPLALTLLIAVALYVPLWYAARTTPGAEARIDELAVPVKALREGDWQPLLEQVATTLQMFHADGDDEWLYNVAHRPVFGPLGAALFFGGVLLAAVRALPPRLGGRADPRHAFLLIWLAGALAPGALAVPAASLGHTLLALPVTYFFPALAIVAGARWLRERSSLVTRHPSRALYLPLAAGLLFLGTESYRGLRDYFHYWPQRGFVRLLHNADYRDLARYLNEQDWESGIGNRELGASSAGLAIGGALVEPWEQQALEIDLQGAWRVRWFDPRRALVAPADGGNLVLTVFPELNPLLLPLRDGPLRVQTKTFTLYDAPALPLGEAAIHFDNGLALHGVADYRIEGDQLTWTTIWEVERPLDVPSAPLLSKPPPPGVPAGSRLAIFAHLLDADGAYLTGQDGLGVDPYTLEPGDRFVHLHRLTLPAEGLHPVHSATLRDADAKPVEGEQDSYQVRMGLYDPRTGQRWHTDGGEDGAVLFILSEDEG